MVKGTLTLTTAATSGRGCAGRRLQAGLWHAHAGFRATWIGERMSDSTVLDLADARWGDFVAGQPDATPFHHPDWGRLIADCYGFRAFAVVISDTGGRIRAGLPVVEVRHLRGQPKWVTLPFTDYCPPLMSAQEDETQLVAALRQASAAAGIHRVEVRAPLAGAAPMEPTPFRHVIALESDPDRVYARFRRGARGQIRQAEHNGLTIRQATDPTDLLDIFYRLHLRSRRRLGVPVQPRRFFRMLWDSMISAGLGVAFIAEASAQPVAVHVCLGWNGTMIGKFSASDDGAWSLRPNHILTWHSLKTACELGYRWFDMGRTDAGNKGLREFKRSWRAVEEPLVYGTLGARPEPAPASNGRAGQLLGSVIRHGPLVVCRAAGETLYRYAA